jgi:type IV pilus assembly protein PilA
MKKHTSLKSKFNSAFSLVELLVVIAVIAIIAAIAIPNISGIIDDAGTAAQRRTAQNLASLASAATAAGYTNLGTNASITQWVEALTNGVTVTNIAGQVFGPFRADGLPTNTDYQTYLTNAGGLLLYKQ